MEKTLDSSSLARDRLWTAREVSAYLGVPVNTLYYWHSERIGPRCARFGRHLRYRPQDVDEWFDARCAGERA